MVCSVCGKEVVSMSQAMKGMAGGKLNVELMAQTGLRCSSCGVVSCQSCAHGEAKKWGNNFFTCPSCAANIGNDQLR